MSMSGEKEKETEKITAVSLDLASLCSLPLVTTAQLTSSVDICLLWLESDLERIITYFKW